MDFPRVDDPLGIMEWYGRIQATAEAFTDYLIKGLCDACADTLNKRGDLEKFEDHVVEIILLTINKLGHGYNAMTARMHVVYAVAMEEDKTKLPDPVASHASSYPIVVTITERLQHTDHFKIVDHHNRTIAQILKRFSNMVMAAAEPLPKTGNIIEHASINRMTMETECAGLIAEIQALLAINREIKGLWIRGPLRQPGEDAAREAAMDSQAENVAKLYDRVLGLRNTAIRDLEAAVSQQNHDAAGIDEATANTFPGAGKRGSGA
ncbi:hypothetical protein F4821DRAFT_254512 [Hypoxylon rubiginosum]|uniref:Uncharacterized protein n=1 Tax=Hypoxylon rubiginosum TaxID=110542 RepID=A0ACC0DGC4_9PEZI|nr:hypothetical protein F4821DRAFT_254512 [Hypoxylon rubiginosum]